MMLRVALLLALCAVSGCTTTYQRRGNESPQPWSQAVHLDEFESLAVPDLGTPDDLRMVARRLDAEARSVERYYVGPRNVDRATSPRFNLNVIEISDDGEFNPGQYTQVMRNLRCELSLADPRDVRDTVHAANRCNDLDGTQSSQGDSKGTLLLVFVHGWHHGCGTCDRDLACYRSVLARLAEAEANLGTGRRVVGVYVGWRGRQLRGNWDYLSIWNRKSTAERLGRTAGKELLNDLNLLWKGHENVTMVTAGHSLGGAFLLSAARGRLTGNVGDVIRGAELAQRVVRTDGSRAEALESGRKAIRSRFGDLLVLLNPAVEAEEWKVFDDDLYDRTLETRMAEKQPDPGKWPAEFGPNKIPLDKGLPYDPEQLPVMIAIGSTADGAVGKFFPASRWIGALNPFEADALWKQNERVAVGHYDSHVTHHLTSSGAARNGDPDYDMRTCTCPTGAITRQEGGVGGGVPTSPPPAATPAMAPGDPRELFDKETSEPSQKIWKLTLDKARNCDRSKSGVVAENCTRGWDRNSPYIVVQADSKVIGAHSDVFNPVVVTFLQEYIASYQRYRSGRHEENVKRGF